MLADRAKREVARQGVEAVARRMAGFYRILRLLDDQGRWATPEIAAIGDRLLPEDLTLESIDDFIDEIRRINDRNGYLSDFARDLWNRPLTELNAGMTRSALSIIPEVVGFAMVLQNLTAAIYSDADLVAALVDHWDRQGAKIGLRGQQGPAFRLKFESVRATFRRGREYVHAKEVPRHFGNFLLPLNILQAAISDLTDGQIGNARTGYVLSRYLPGNDPDPGTGAGPLRLAAGGKVIETGLPLAEGWADLYQSWNLAFGAQFDSFPLYACKLIIPQVAAYQEAPQQYIWNRVNALTIYLYFSGFASYDAKQGKAVQSAYRSRAWSAFAAAGLRKRWGDMNHRNAVDLQSRIARARLGTAR